MNKRRLLLFFSISIFFFGIFALFSWFVHQDTTLIFDTSATQAIQKTIPRFLDPLLSVFSLLGSFELITFVLVLCYFVIRKYRYAGIFALYTAGHFIELFGKRTIVHPGPPQEYFRYSLRFFLPTAHIHSSFAYPSGHTFRTVFVAFIIAFLAMNADKLSSLQKKGTLAGISIFLIVMMVSRVSLGEHWISDVIGGTALAISFAFLSFFILEFPFPKKNIKRKRMSLSKKI